MITKLYSSLILCLSEIASYIIMGIETILIVMGLDTDLYHAIITLGIYIPLKNDNNIFENKLFMVGSGSTSNLGIIGDPHHTNLDDKYYGCLDKGDHPNYPKYRDYDDTGDLTKSILPLSIIHLIPLRLSFPANPDKHVACNIKQAPSFPSHLISGYDLFVSNILQGIYASLYSATLSINDARLCLVDGTPYMSRYHLSIEKVNIELSNIEMGLRKCDDIISTYPSLADKYSENALIQSINKQIFDIKNNRAVLNTTASFITVKGYGS